MVDAHDAAGYLWKEMGNLDGFMDVQTIPGVGLFLNETNPRSQEQTVAGI